MANTKFLLDLYPEAINALCYPFAYKYTRQPATARGEAVALTLDKQMFNIANNCLTLIPP
jgi:hypothetical protein